MTQRVTIVGPNLRDQSKGDFHVHATGCADLKRDPNLKRENQSWTIEASSREDIAMEVYSDMIEEGDSATDYLSSFHFAPCVTLPEYSGAPTPFEPFRSHADCTLSLTTPELREGDVVHTHDMLCLIDGPIKYADSRNGGVFYYAALVLNRTDVGDEHVPYAFTSVADGTHRWSIQGNERAYWCVTR